MADAPTPPPRELPAELAGATHPPALFRVYASRDARKKGEPPAREVWAGCQTLPTEGSHVELDGCGGTVFDVELAQVRAADGPPRVVPVVYLAPKGQATYAGFAPGQGGIVR